MPSVRWLLCTSLLLGACGQPTSDALRARLIGAARLKPLGASATLAQKRGEEPPTRDRSPEELPEVHVTPLPHPLVYLSDEKLAKLFAEDPQMLGAGSIGQPNRGRLWNGVQAQSNHLFEVVDPEKSWATPATIAGLTRAVSEVHAQFPNTPPLHLGDMSRERGGYLRPHRSHQSGVDADVSYYYTTGQRWYLEATIDNLDRARSWALVRALVGDPTVEYVFIDYRVQLLLREHAENQGEAAEFLDSAFGGLARRTEAPIRHTWGHRTHLHVRFHDPVARETARRVYPLLQRARWR